jgi:hypothetical protein
MSTFTLKRRTQNAWEARDAQRAAALTQSEGFNPQASAVCSECQALKGASKRVGANTFTRSYCPSCTGDERVMFKGHTFRGAPVSPRALAR